MLVNQQSSDFLSDKNNFLIFLIILYQSDLKKMTDATNAPIIAERMAPPETGSK
tara:strand:- start:356 stop:517 length:162 start_codon:yes stop_codon:yes gene_type:complete